MGYSLGIDLGRSACAAAVRHGTAVEPAMVGEDGPTMPTVALPRADGTTLVGEAADDHSPYEPTLVARQATARLTQPGPMVIDGRPYDLLMMTEALIGTVIDRAAPEPGAFADQVVLTYPLLPPDGPEQVLAEAAARVLGEAPTMVPEPIAAVAKLAYDRDLGPDTMVAVVDFGGSSVDVALVRRTADAFDLVGDPASRLDVGGVDLDAQVLALVEATVGDVTSMVRADDPVAMADLRGLRVACRDAKERLSSEPVAMVEVALPQAQGRVEVTRQALESAVEPLLSQAVDLLLSTIGQAGLSPAQVDLVLLTGGTAHMPRWPQLVSETTGLPVVRDDDPELTIAQGAALFAEGAIADHDPADAGGVPPAPDLSLGPDLPVGAATGAVLDVPPGAASPPVTGMSPAGYQGTSVFADTGPQLPAAHEGPHEPEGPVGGHTGTSVFADAGGFPDTGGFPPTGGMGATLPPTPPPSSFEPEPWPAEDGWDGQHDQGWDEPETPWDDERTSVFDPTPAPTGMTERVADRGQSSGDEFERLTTSDTDPFGGSRGGSLASRLRERRNEMGDDEFGEFDDGDPTTFDMRLVVGGVVAAMLVVLIGGWVLIAGTGGNDDPAIAVADTSATTTRSSSSSSSSSTTVPSTSEATTTSVDATTTTVRSRPGSTTTTARPSAPPPTEPPATTPTTPPTPPTTAPPPTTTEPTTTIPDTTVP